MTEACRIELAADSRSAEALLLAEVSRLAAADGDRAALAAPLRVVVPSGSLREHLLARLTALRPAWLGVEVSNLRAIARTILTTVGEPHPPRGDLLPIFLERAARRRRVLARAVGDFTGGWAPLAAAASDLVNAGFEAALAPALMERIDAERAALPAPTLERARAFVEALAEALGELERHGLATESTILVRAADALARQGESALPARAVFVHGFADATGVAGDLLSALVGYAGARALLLAPEGDGELGYGVRLRERLESAGGRARRGAAVAAAPARLELLVAPTPALEARALAAAAQAEIEAGVRAEGIAIVLRDPGRARSALARELDRLGVPFSASAASGPLAPLARRTRVLLDLLERGAAISADAALELLADAHELPVEHRASVRLALRALGVARLGDAARLERRPLQRHREDGYPLPARAGTASDPEGAEYAPRRRLPLTILIGALERLAALLAAVDRWPAKAAWAGHSAALDRLLEAAALAGGGDGATLRELAAERAGRDLPSDLELEAREARQLLAGAWEGVERQAWGGAGGGVQILSVTEARARTFTHLFVGGLTRGHFPRTITEEPLLPDTLRLRLRELLPDLPVKRDGHEEERFLFGQLLGTAPRVVLSRSTHDDDGRPLPASPLLEALLRSRDVPRLDPPTAEPSSALARAVDAALTGGTAAVAPHLGAALEEGRRRFAPGARLDSAAAGAARHRILVEFDTDPTTADGLRRALELGPYFGFVAPESAGAAVSATTLEAQARCAWQSFLTKTLRLEPTPDPLGALPGIDALLLGSAVHDALARLFAEGHAETERASLADRIAGPGRPLAWPEASQVSRAATDSAERALAVAGLAGRGLERPLARQIERRLEIARALDADSPGADLLGVEVDGQLQLPDGAGGSIAVRFRADRLQREAERLVAVDFKTGKVPPGLDSVRPDKRREHLLAAVGSGARLQAALYALALAPPPAEGRYSYLSPEDDAPARAIGIAADDDVSATLGAAIATLVGARRLGLHPPRLLEPKLDREYKGCEFCAVAEACVRGDSGYRLRLERWHTRELERSASRSERGEALWRLWRLPANETRVP